MKDDLDLRHLIARELRQSGGDRLESVAPALAAMAGDQDIAAVPRSRTLRRGQLPFNGKQGVDAGVAGDVDRAADPLACQIGGSELGRSEQ